MYFVKHFKIKKELTPWLSGVLAASLLAGAGYTAYSQLTVKSPNVVIAVAGRILTEDAIALLAPGKRL